MRNDAESGEWQDWLVDETMDQETALAESEERDHRRDMLNEALEGLNARERRSSKRAGSPRSRSRSRSCRPSSASRERIRQIEVRAFEKVQKAVQKAASAQAREPAPAQ